jgi:glutathione S-transferase
LLLSVLGRIPIDQASAPKVQSELTTRLQVLDAHLKNNQFFVGSRLTIADIQAATVVFPSYQFLVGEAQRKQLPNLSRWFSEISALPSFVKSVGRPRICKTAFPLNFAVAEQKPQKEEKPKEEKPAKKE